MEQTRLTDDIWKYPGPFNRRIGVKLKYYLFYVSQNFPESPLDRDDSRPRLIALIGDKSRMLPGIISIIMCGPVGFLISKGGTCTDGFISL